MALAMTYNAGRLDRRVLLEVYSETVNANGERTSTWDEYDWRSAEILNTSAGETVSGDRLIISTSTTFRVRYDRKVNEKYRLRYENMIYNISGIVEVGRRRFMDLICEAVAMSPELTMDNDVLTVDSDKITADMNRY